ncbi:hypothetical protein AAFF_G00313870 [Aldrovandia affinis]|uniref:Synaptonemal complex protein 1 n=1 Tax=Aldrovandia affinis TaxID=143900 RepID=A0AAD7W0N8_9TELE|nr:hypothetical protein AAFF_G00313870 [Aldrovandia affinis]
MPFPATSMVAPSKSTRQDAAKKIAVMPMEKEETTLRSCQLYSRLFEEAEKIKYWKANIDMEVVQKDIKLQENKRTIENQRKAILELQFGTEGLSTKLEEEMSKNTDLMSKTNSTRNLCNLLKETFERSSEKMQLYESEREETHLLFMQNSSTIAEAVSALEGLRVQAYTDGHDLLKLKEELKQCDETKDKIEAEFRIKHKEVTMLHVKMNDKENELREILQSLQEARQNCSQLHKAAQQHQEMLEESKQEQEMLSEKLERAEQANKESEENRKALETTLAQTKEEYSKALVEKGNSLEELKKMRDEQAEKHQEILVTAEKLQVTLVFQVQRVKELEQALGSVTVELKLKTSELEKLQMEETKALQLAKDVEGKNAEIHQLMSKLLELELQLSVALANEEKSEEIERLKKDIEQQKKDHEELMARFIVFKNEDCEKRITEELERGKEEKQQLRDELESLKATFEEQSQVTGTLYKRQGESNKKLQNELTKREKQMKVVEMKNKNLKRQIVTENGKYSQLETEANELKEELKSVQALHGEELTSVQALHGEELTSVQALHGEELKSVQALHGEELKVLQEAIETKCSTESELQEKVQAVQIMAAEAVKSKEEIEIKCQHKISDMVALMDKHKNQYGKMVEEKDGELEEKRKKEMEVKAEKTSLELELSELKIDNSDLKIKLEDEVKEKETLKHEVGLLSKKVKTLKEDLQQKAKNTLTPVANSKGIRGPSSPNTSFKSRATVFDFPNEQENESSKTPSCSTAKKFTGTPLYKVSETGILKTSWSSGNQVGRTPRIQSYRIRTPPSPGKSRLLGRNALELDAKSDSSEQNDSLSFSVQPDVFKRNLYPGDTAPLRQYGNLHKKGQSPAAIKSPGTALKLAAVKRMRDAGWTAVTSTDKRKKKASDKIFV